LTLRRENAHLRVGTFQIMAKLRRLIMALLVAAASPAAAEEVLNATAARAFVAGKLFNFRCFDGTHGAGYIFNDGSVTGRITFGGQGILRYMRLPVGTLYERGDQICATLRGLPFDPCFNLTRTSPRSFRGALASFGLGFMYCDFHRDARTIVARRRGPSTTGSIPTGATPASP
jgi:hypothetical protein